MKSSDVTFATPSSTRHPDDASKQRPFRILLVEDHADTAVVLTRILQQSGYDVFPASTLRAARETAEKHLLGEGLDLVVSDLTLPDGSGLSLMKSLSDQHGLRGIALSGSGSESDIQQSKAAGFSRHLIKPVNMAAVRNAIAELLNS